jgi:hypothetical protein
MAALFPKIYDIIDTNPHKDEIIRCCTTTSTKDLPLEVWDIFTLLPLDPPGALSFLLFHMEPMYELGTPALRKQVLTEHLLTVHERVDKELVGRRYPRKKIQDLLAKEIAVTAPRQSQLIDDVLCELFHLQKITIHRKTKSLSFSPSDLRLWTSSKRILIAEEDNLWSYQPIKSFLLSNWLQDKEQEGWKIPWPTADGKLDEVKAGLLQRNVSYDPKLKKDDLASLLGRTQALGILSELQIQLNPVKLETP